MNTKMTGVEVTPHTYRYGGSAGSRLRKMVIGSHLRRGTIPAIARQLSIREDYLNAALSARDDTEITDRLSRNLEHCLRLSKNAFSLPVLIKKHPEHYYNLALLDKISRLQEGDPTAIAYKEVHFTFGALSGTADLAITDPNGTLRVIGLQRDPDKIESSYQELKGLMLMSGAQYGLIYDPAQSTSIGDHWFMQLDGELIETNNPEFAPHKMEKMSDVMGHLRAHH